MMRSRPEQIWLPMEIAFLRAAEQLQLDLNVSSTVQGTPLFELCQGLTEACAEGVIKSRVRPGLVGGVRYLGAAEWRGMCACWQAGALTAIDAVAGLRPELAGDI